jgi:glutathione synthase/RimK-type ligase-like ATP-grasp enzyme
MILIVSHEGNEHVEQVRRHLTGDSVVVNTAWFPGSLGLEAEFGRLGERLALALPDGRHIDLSAVGAVWYRRISAFDLPADLVDPVARLFAWSETNEAVLGLWYSLDCYWMNRPTADEISQRKIRQLQVARKLGLSVPETLITNEAAAAREFVQRHGVGRVVRKAFRNIPQAPRTTALVGESELALIESVRYAPVIFQEFVPADVDLRVTVIGDEIFAAAIHSEPAYRTDYRLGLESATVVPYQLPAGVAAGVLDLMKEFDIQYGALDFRVTPEGEHVFLEVNPAGEYLFISQRTGQPIAAAIAAALERHDRAWQSRAPYEPATITAVPDLDPFA